MKKTELNISNIKFDIYNDQTVFGDGTHETTKSILNLLSKYEIKNKFVMDVGTGTGILSVFAALSGASRVLAIDINGGSLEWARKNFKTNNVNVDIELNNLTEGIDDKADIIMANLPTPEQVENMKNIRKNLAKDGVLIISWINILPIENHIGDFEIVECVEGEEYSAYVLK